MSNKITISKQGEPAPNSCYICEKPAVRVATTVVNISVGLCEDHKECRVVYEPASFGIVIFDKNGIELI
jgi:hypothetical protein